MVYMPHVAPSPPTHEGVVVSVARYYSIRLLEIADFRNTKTYFNTFF